MTATTAAAKAHAREQEALGTGPMPVVPARNWPTPPVGVEPAALTRAETVPGGRYTTCVLGRGTRLRLRDIDGRACAHVMLHRADAPWERLSTADTVKVPWQAYLGVGHPLLSDQGRVLATVVGDTSGHHDALCGASTRRANDTKYGAGEVHSASPAARELLLLGLAKNGLSPRDLPPTVSFFHGVRVDDDGRLIDLGSAGPDRTVELVIHLPLVVTVANAAHPLDPSPTYDTTDLEVLAWAAPIAEDDLPLAEPEYRRALANTDALVTALEAHA